MQYRDSTIYIIQTQFILFTRLEICFVVMNLSFYFTLTDVKGSLFLVLMRELYNDHCLQSNSLDVHHGTITCSVSLYATTAGVTLSPASFATTSARPSYMKTITLIINCIASGMVCLSHLFSNTNKNYQIFCFVADIFALIKQRKKIYTRN